MTRAKRRGAGRPTPHPAAPSPEESDRDDEGDRVRQLPLAYVLNSRFLAVSALVAVGLAGGLFGLHWAQQHRLQGALRERAEKTLADGDEAAAARQLRQYLLLSPDDLDARLQLDTLQWEHAETRPQIEKALLSSEALLRDHPDLEDVRRRQVEKLLVIGRHSDALDHLATLRESGADDAALDVWEGLSYEMADEFREAEQSYLRVVNREENFPPVPYGERELTRFNIIGRLAVLYMGELNDESLAYGIVNDAIDRFPKSAELLTLRARLRATTDDSEDALLVDLDKAVALSAAAESLPDMGTVLLYASQLRRSVDPQPERVERVIGYCRGLAAVGTDDYRLFQEWAALESARSHADEALKILRQGTTALPDDPMMAAFLADELISREQFRDAKAVLSDPEGPSLSGAIEDYLKGRLAMAKEDWPAARDLFRSAQSRRRVPASIQSRASLYLGACYRQLGAYDRELACYRDGHVEEGVEVAVQLADARCLANLGRLDEAARAYRRLPSTAFDPVERLRAELNRAVQQSPARRDWKPFDEALSDASRISPDDPAIALVRAESLTARGQRKEAADELRRSTDKWPSHLELWTARIDFAVAEGDSELATDILDAARQVHGPHVRLTASEIPLWEQGEKPDALVRLAELETSLTESSVADRVFVTRRLAESYERLEEHEQAFRLRKSLAFDLSPTPDSLLTLFALSLKAGDRETATAVRDRLRRLSNEEDAWTTYANVMLELTIGKPDRQEIEQALKALGELSRRPTVPLFSLARASLHEQIGYLREATDDYMAAVEHGVRDPQVLRRLMVLLSAQHRYDDIERVSGMLSVRPATSSAYQQMLSEAALLTGQTDRAAAHAEGAFQGSADSLWKARLLLAAGKIDEAEAFFRQATEDSPQRDEAWLALAQFLIEQQRPDDAQAVAMLARTNLVSAESKGWLEEILGNLADAEAWFLAVSADGMSVSGSLALAAFFSRTNQLEQSIPVLEDLLNRTGDTSGADRVAARRMLAAALASRNYAGLKRALRLLDQNVDEVNDPSLDRRQRAHVLALFPFPGHASRIIEILEGLRRHQPLNAADTVILARAYDIQGDEQPAAASWESLLAIRDLRPQMLKAYVERQLRHGRPDSVEGPLARLEDAAGDNSDVMRFKGWVLCLSSEPDDAVALIDRFIDSSPEHAGIETAKRKLLAAGVLRQLVDEFPGDDGRSRPLAARATQLYRQINDDLPSSVLPYSLLLTAQNHGVEAVDVLEKVQGKIPETQRLAAAIYVQETAVLPEEATRKIRNWVTENSHSRNSVESAMLYEHFLRVTGEFEQAAELNRQLMAMMPENINLLNNQAWLLTALGDAQGAVTLVERAIELAGPRSSLLDTRGMARLSMNNTADGIEDLNNALAQKESDIVRYHLALAYLRAGNEETARVNFGKIRVDRADIRRLLPISEQEEFDRIVETHAMP